MELTFKIKYDSGSQPFKGLDQYDGALSLLGFSQVLLISLNAFFNREIITQAPSAKGFRIVLGTNKHGSWEQLLQLVTTDPNVRETLSDLGKSGLYDLLKWVFSGAVGLTGFSIKNRRAKRIMRELERENEDLQEKLDEAIKRMHYPVKHSGLTVHVMAGRTTLARFDDDTLRHIETEIVHDATKCIRVAASRFNARTGTGRFIKKMDTASVPFYPDDKLTDDVRMMLADSLAELTRDRFAPIEAVVSEVTSIDGHLKSYRLHTARRLL